MPPKDGGMARRPFFWFGVGSLNQCECVERVKEADR